MEINSKELGKIIKERRMELGLKQTTLAKIVGTSQAYISDLEKGKKENPTAATLAKLADALEIDREELLAAIIKDKRERLALISKSNRRRFEETTRLMEAIEDIPDIRKIARAGQKMTPEQRKKWIEMGKLLFEEAFKEEDGEEDKDE